MNDNGTDITLKGSEDGFHLAVWQADGFSYSLNSSVGLSVDAIQTLVESLY